MWSTRDSSVSTWPYSIVALLRSPAACTASITSSHRSPEIFSGQIRLRISGEKISAPPPGRLPNPASLSCAITSSSGSPVIFAK